MAPGCSRSGGRWCKVLLQLDLRSTLKSSSKLGDPRQEKRGKGDLTGNCLVLKRRWIDLK